MATTRVSLLSSLLACGALALSLTACSAPDPRANEASACDAYATFAAALDDARTSLSASSTIGEITAARDEIRTAYGKLQSTLEKVGEDRTSALEGAWNTFDRAVDDIDTGLTIPDAVASLQEEVAGIADAERNLDEALSCD